MLKLIMKNKLLNLLLLIFTIFFLVIFFIFKENKPQTSFSRYIIDGHMYHLLVARNPIQWSKGLMYYKSKDELKDIDGMIFIFPDKEIKSFWNKNTYLDLDIYWMDGEKVIGKGFLPSILKSKEIIVVKSPGEVNRVVEIIK